jgi:uncharacterized protein (TIGR02271 family)
MTSQDRPSSTAINTLVATGNLDLLNPFTEVHLDDGRILRLSTSQLAESLAISELPVLSSSGQTLIPLIEEQLQVSKRVVPTGLVRLRKGVEEFDAKIDEILAVRTYDIERVVLNQLIETVPTVRTDGYTTIYPLVEERLVLTKQLILKEEVRVTRRDTERVDTQTVVLSREHLVVEREPLK